MVELKSISEHRPKGMIIDIAEEDAEELIKTGEFIKSIGENLILKKKEEKKKEDKDEVKEDIDEKDNEKTK